MQIVDDVYLGCYKKGGDKEKKLGKEKSKNIFKISKSKTLIEIKGKFP